MKDYVILGGSDGTNAQRRFHGKLILSLAMNTLISNNMKVSITARGLSHQASSSRPICRLCNDFCSLTAKDDLHIVPGTSPPSTFSNTLIPIGREQPTAILHTMALTQFPPLRMYC